MPATIFDFNGVLVDDEHVHLAAFQDVLRPLGITVTDEAYNERYLGFDDVGAFRAMLEDHGRTADHAVVRALVEAKKPAYMARIETGLRIFEGAAALVARRAARGRVGIVSGALEHEIRYALGHMGVLEKVEFIVSAERTKACKPDPEGYLLGLAALGGAREGVVVIEDSIAGIQSARAAGLRCAAVAHSYPEGDLVRAGADVVAARLEGLTDARLDLVADPT